MANISTPAQKNAQKVLHEMIDKHYQSDIKRKLYIDYDYINRVQFYK